MRRSYLLKALICCCIMFFRSALAEENKATTMKMAISLAIKASSRLKASEASITAKLGNRQQAGLIANPVFGFQMENFLGNGRYRGWQNSEITYGITQPIEIAGQRTERMSAAEQSVASSRHELEIERLDVIRDVKVAYANAVLADDMLLLSQEQKARAQELFSEVGRRVKASRESSLQQSMAEINLANASLAFEQAVRERQHALHVLSSLWEGDDHSLILDKSKHFDVARPPGEAWLLAELPKNPSFKLMQAEKNRRNLLFELERASAFPDLHVNIGLRDLRANNELAVVAGLSFPLPIFNRNQGNIARARSEILVAEENEHASIIKMQGLGFEALENMLNAYRRVDTIRKTILPAADRAFAISHQGYLIGKYSYLEVLNAARTLFDTKVQNASALNEYHRAHAEIERLTGGLAQETSHEP